MYDPQGMLRDFKFQARPEACTGTPESIESHGLEVARASKGRSGEELVRLTPEAVPVGTPPGWRAFRFTHRKEFFIGTVCGVEYDWETGNTVFVLHDTPPQESWKESGPPSFFTRQDGPEPQESHILIPPNGYVSPELIARDGEINTDD